MFRNDRIYVIDNFDVGIPGPTGSQGISGLSGAVGAIGPTGVPGPQGKLISYRSNVSIPLTYFYRYSRSIRPSRSVGCCGSHGATGLTRKAFLSFEAMRITG